QSFADRLPRSASRGSVDRATCEEALREGTLSPAPAARPLPPVPVAGTLDWAALGTLAGDAFTVDKDGAEPRSWDEVKEYVERYLKPVLFASIAEVEPLDPNEPPDIRTLAERVHADRGTVVK